MISSGSDAAKRCRRHPNRRTREAAAKLDFGSPDPSVALRKEFSDSQHKIALLEQANLEAQERLERERLASQARFDEAHKKYVLDLAATQRSVDQRNEASEPWAKLTAVYERRCPRLCCAAGSTAGFRWPAPNRATR